MDTLLNRLKNEILASIQADGGISGGAINDEDLYLKAQFKCVYGPYTITTTKKSFVLDSTHNDIVETIYFNEPITVQYQDDDAVDIYDDFDFVYRDNDPNEVFSDLNIADDIDVIFMSEEQE